MKGSSLAPDFDMDSPTSVPEVDLLRSVQTEGLGDFSAVIEVVAEDRRPVACGLEVRPKGAGGRTSA